MNYSSKLRDPRWQKKRLEIMQRDEFTCLFCHSGLTGGKNLQVHHILYKRRDPWDYPNYLYQTLCDECHQHRTELTDKVVDAIRIAVAKVPTERLIEAVQILCGKAMLEIDMEDDCA